MDIRSVYNTYGFLGTINIIKAFVYTKLFYRSAYLVKPPFDIRGRKFITWGTNFTIGTSCRLEAYPIDKSGPVLKIGNNVQINDHVHITAVESVTIGNNVLMASKIYISDSSHGSYGGMTSDSDPDIAPALRPLTAKPVLIEDNVWLGENVAVLPGVTIGKGTIVGTNAVVTKSLPPYVIAAGIPAIPIKRFNKNTGIWERI